ncbi:MAG: hypothetical protein ACI9E5_000029, partial [Candidatus Omnitrophota bacterium]
MKNVIVGLILFTFSLIASGYAQEVDIQKEYYE